MNLSRISVLVALAAAVLLLLFLPEAWKMSLREASMDVMDPAIHLIDRTKIVLTKFRRGWSTLEELEKENTELVAKNAELSTENTVLKDMAEENSRLRELLGFKKSTQYRLLAARMVGRDPGNWWIKVLVNRGYDDDASLRTDLPVVNARGLIGKTGAVKKGVTEVILLNNQNCKISARVEDLPIEGLLVGDGNVDDGKPRCRLTFINRTAELSIGQRVFTSGLGGVIPAGVLLGTISEVPPLSPKVNFGLFREVYVEPVVDLGQLNEMFIVLEAPVQGEGASSEK